MTEVFIVDGARTPQGRYGGALASVRPDDLAALVVDEAVGRSGIGVDSVDEVVLGCVNQAGEDNRNVARMAVLLSGLPETVPAYTVNRLCASGMTALATAAGSIRSGEADVVVAGGVESMTRAPWVLAKPGAAWAKPGEIFDTALGWRFTNPKFGAETTLSMGETAEEVATLIGITRAESDAFAVRSQQRAIAAIDAGRFEKEIVPVPVGDDVVTVDEGPRRGSDEAKLARLRPAFRKDGIVTAASSSFLTDGATALVLASEDAVRRHGLTPRARIVGSASAALAPNIMGLGPVPATRKLLDRVGWSLGDIGAIELNEAFAAQSIGVIRQLDLDESIVNADGGAIALGHPLGASGARIVLTLLGRLEREGARRGLATLCVGVGQGVSMVVESV
ncbi:thiolase family protein [Millisia brevis]|uniref:thiolase family protein n=1 Tax=Millisia brevis TaxID=264148 RepID=UPI0008379A3B|nr:thiolase family protein [Millisia brevis]